jgi:hypothetical protein
VHEKYILLSSTFVFRRKLPVLRFINYAQKGGKYHLGLEKFLIGPKCTLAIVVSGKVR